MLLEPRPGSTDPADAPLASCTLFGGSGGVGEGSLVGGGVSNMVDVTDGLCGRCGRGRPLRCGRGPYA